jgi:orotate phosphoribosyltransferase
VDDVCTSGGHLQAAAAAIRQAGAEVLFAVCAAQSESVEPLGGAFAVRERELEDVDP